LARDEILRWADLRWGPGSQAVGAIGQAPLWNPKAERRKWFAEHFKTWAV